MDVHFGVFPEFFLSFFLFIYPFSISVVFVSIFYFKIVLLLLPPVADMSFVLFVNFLIEFSFIIFEYPIFFVLLDPVLQPFESFFFFHFYQ